MATFEVEVEGKKYDVDAPDERTAWAWANQSHLQYKQGIAGDVSKIRQGNALQRGLRGAGASVQNAAYGIKDIFTDLSPEERRTVDVNKQFMDEDTAGAVGGFATDVASFALPGGLVAKGVTKALPMLPRAARAIAGLGANAAADAGLSAAYSTDDKSDAALIGGISSVAGQGATRALGKLIGGPVKVSDDAARMMSEGVDVPIWKGAQNQTIRDVSERAKVLPMTGAVMRGQEREAMGQWNKNIAARATPPMPVVDEAGRVLRWENKPIKEVGAEALESLRNRFNDAYNALYKGRGIPVDDVYGREVTDVVAGVKNYYPRLGDEFDAAVRQVDDILRKGTETTTKVSPIVDVSGRKFRTDELGHAATTPESLKQAIDKVEERITSAWRRGDGELAEALGAVRESLTDLRVRALPPEVASAAKPINNAYVTFKELQRANNSVAAQKAGMATPTQVLAAIRAGDKSPGKSMFASNAARTGNLSPSAVNQQDALRAANVLGSRLPEVGPGTAEKLSLAYMINNPRMFALDAGAAFMTGSPSAQRFLMGGYSRQKAIEEALRQGSFAGGNVLASQTYD